MILFPSTGDAKPDLAMGLLALWDPAVLLCFEVLWIVAFLYTGRSGLPAPRSACMWSRKGSDGLYGTITLSSTRLWGISFFSGRLKRSSFFWKIRPGGTWPFSTR